MEYDRSTTKDKWTIMMYMRDFNLMATYAYALRASNNLSNDNIDDILSKMEADGVYHPRNGGSTFTGTFKSIQIDDSFRAEKPQVGRNRQLTQCDIDIWGFDSILGEIEIITTTMEAYYNLGLRNVTCKISNRNRRKRNGKKYFNL